MEVAKGLAELALSFDSSYLACIYLKPVTIKLLDIGIEFD